MNVYYNYVGGIYSTVLGYATVELCARSDSIGNCKTTHASVKRLALAHSVHAW